MRTAVMLPLLLAVMLCCPVGRALAGAEGEGGYPTGAAAPGISDGGMFFSEESASEAEDVIRAIRQSYGRDVVVETYAAVPEDLKAELARDGKDKFYEAWLNRRAKERHVRGLFVLMTREPRRVQVGVDRATRARWFTVKDRETLRDILTSAFRMNQFDRGLLEGLRFVRRRIGENAAPSPAPGPGPTVPVGAPAVACASPREIVR